MGDKQKNVEFFKGALPALLENPMMINKFVIIHECAVKGAYDTFGAALRAAVAVFAPAEFIIQQVIDDRDVISFIHAGC